MGEDPEALLVALAESTTVGCWAEASEGRKRTMLEKIRRKRRLTFHLTLN
jgi:hypothetical protein